MKTPLFSAAVHLKLEPELHENLAAAARREFMTTSEFMRRTLRARVAERRFAVTPCDDDPGLFDPSRGQRLAA